MKINKYNKPKDNSVTGRAGGATTIINGSTSDRAAYSDESGRLAETHLIFGQPFNGTQDVAGDLSNVQNITATGGDITVNSITDADGTKGGNISADGNIAAGGNVTGTTFIGDVDAENITTNTITAGTGSISSLSGSTIQYDNAQFQQAIINALSSVDITTENLTVTNQAHFFELIIDKIKAAGGAIILTPADGFKIDKVLEYDTFYRVLWRSTDGERAIKNMWKVGDQAICQTFNNAEVGTNYNISNKYYWALVTAVGSDIIGKDDTEYHYIDISKSDYDGTLNPEVGDEIAMLGYRGNDDASRQSAIYLTAYNSLDPTLTAPLFCHYKGVNDFNLSSHKYTWFAANGNEIRGNLKVETGQTLQDYLDNNLPSAGESAYLHTAYSNSADGSVDFTKNNTSGDYLYIGLCSNFKVSDEDLTYSDYIWTRLKGDSVKVVTTSVEYAVSSQGTTAPTTGWQTSIPYVPPANYLWTKHTIYYSDGTTAQSYMVVRYGANGSKGDKGDDGADGSSYTENLLTNTRLFDGDEWVNKEYWQETGEVFQGLKVLCRDDNGYGIYQKFQAVAGETYTFSAWLKSDGGDAKYYFTITGSGIVTPLTKDVPESSEWTRQAVSFTCTESGEIACRVQKATGTGAVYIAGYKLERGTNANTVWTPAATEVAGQDAVRRFLIADSAAFQKGSNGVITPAQITVRAYKQIGEGTVTECPEAVVRVLVTDNDGAVTTFDEDNGDYTVMDSVIVNYQATQFTFQLVWFGSILDSLTVPVISNGQDADYYKLVPITERALVQNTGNLDVQFRYQVAHIVGKNEELISTTDNGYRIRFKGNTENEYKYLSSSFVPYYADEAYQEQYVQNIDEIIEYFTVELVNGSTVLDTRLISVKVNTAAILEITDNISARVQSNNQNITTNTNNIAQLQIKADGISSTVQQHTTTINALDGAMQDVQADISRVEQTAQGIKTTVESHSETLGEHSDKISEIEQTAESIRLQVDDIAIKVDDKKIVLDGDTEINGNLTMDNGDQGFTLKGDSGITQITPQSIGSYANFSSKATITIPIGWSDNKTLIANSTITQVSTYSLGNIAANTYITLKDGKVRTNGVENYGGITVKEVLYKLKKDNVTVKQYDAGSFKTSATILNYTTTAAGNYSVEIQYSITSINTTTALFTSGLNVVLPTSCFNLIGYDGVAMNFGNQKTVYFGNEGAYISYGNKRLKIDSTGIYKYGGVVSLQPSTMTEGDGTDSAYSRYLTEYAPINGCVVRQLVTFGTSYLQPNDEFILFAGVSGEQILQLPTPSQNKGRQIYIKRISDGGTYTLKGTMMPANQNGEITTFNVGTVSQMLICDGTHWILF